jgi:hypothetical protein
MTKHEFHNALRVLLNIETDQLSFLTPIQQDNFFGNPHMFFVRCDDETADKLWAIVQPPRKTDPPMAGGNVIPFTLREPGEDWPPVAHAPLQFARA